MMRFIEDTGSDVDYSRQEIDTSSVPLVFSYERPEPILVERWSAEDAFRPWIRRLTSLP